MLEVQNWLLETQEHIIKSGVATAKINILSGLVHQRDSETECGPYSVYYIWNRLNGVPASEFQKKRIPDAKMIKFRAMCWKS